MKRLDDLLETAIALGLCTREMAEERDAWADTLALRLETGELSDAEVADLVSAQAKRDARAMVARRRQS